MTNEESIRTKEVKKSKEAKFISSEVREKASGRGKPGKEPDITDIPQGVPEETETNSSESES